MDGQSRAVAATYPVEFRVGPPDTDLLKAIAEASGGRYDPKPADLLADSDRVSHALCSFGGICWPWPRQYLSSICC